MEIDHDIISTAILSLWLIQVGSCQLVDVHLILVYRVGRVVRLTDCLDMTIVVDWDIKPQIKPTKLLLGRLSPLKELTRT